MEAKDDMTLLLLLLTNESVLDDDPGDSDVKNPVTTDHHDEVLLLVWDDISSGCSVTGGLVASACVAVSKGVELCTPSFSTSGCGGGVVVPVVVVDDVVAANLSAAACNAVVRVMTGGSVAHGYS
jgi:hypothetical protein